MRHIEKQLHIVNVLVDSAIYATVQSALTVLEGQCMRICLTFLKVCVKIKLCFCMSRWEFAMVEEGLWVVLKLNEIHDLSFNEIGNWSHGGIWRTMHCRLCLNCYGTSYCVCGGGVVKQRPLSTSWRHDRQIDASICLTKIPLSTVGAENFTYLTKSLWVGGYRRLYSTGLLCYQNAKFMSTQGFELKSERQIVSYMLGRYDQFGVTTVVRPDPKDLPPLVSAASSVLLEIWTHVLLIKRSNQTAS